MVLGRSLHFGKRCLFQDLWNVGSEGLEGLQDYFLIEGETLAQPSSGREPKT